MRTVVAVGFFERATDTSSLTWISTENVICTTAVVDGRTYYVEEEP